MKNERLAAYIHIGTAILDSALITLNPSLKMVGRLGFAPSSRRLRAGTSLSKFATLVAVCKDCDAKAELKRRPDFRIGTRSWLTPGFRIALKWSERRVTLPLTLAPEASASLLGYVLFTPSALNLMSGHLAVGTVFDRARSLPTNRVQLGAMARQAEALAKAGRA